MARTMIEGIVPQLKAKIEKLLTDSVDKLLLTVENQDMKIAAIKEVLKRIKEARDGENGADEDESHFREYSDIRSPNNIKKH